MTRQRRPFPILRIAAERPAKPMGNPMADAGPDSMTRLAGVAGAGPGRGNVGDTASAAEVTLRILATSDIHANILSYDYAANRPLFGQGLAQTASLIAAARAEVPGAILLDNGDFLQGSALADLAAGPHRKRIHPVIAAFNALHYDAATLGNHEFNFGLDVLNRAVADARFPIVSANVLVQRAEDPLQDQTFIRPYALIARDLTDQFGKTHTIQLGVLGLTPPEILQWDREHLQNRLDARPMSEAARAWVPQVRRAGADVVVCLAHTGIADTIGGVDSEGMATEIAALDGVDALIAGHSHLVFPTRLSHIDPRVSPVEGLLAGKPTVQPGYGGSHLGVIDLRLRLLGGSWRVVGSVVRTISVSEVVAGLPAQTIRRNAEPLRRAVISDHRAALAWTRRTLGTSTFAMSTCFAQVADVAAMGLLAQAKITYVRRALAGSTHAQLPVLAAVTPYRAGGRGGALNYADIPAGPLSVRHLFDLYPFPNTLVALVTTGAELAELLERAASLFMQMRPGGQDQLLIDPTFPSFVFTTISGLVYRIDPSQPARYDFRGRLVLPQARRVIRIEHDGKPVSPADRFVLVTNNYRSGGTMGIPSPLPQDIVLEDRLLCTDVLRAFLQSCGPVTRETCDGGGNWGFMRLPGTTVLFDTGAGAADHLAEAAHLRPEFVGLTDEGFHRYRLYL